MRRPMITKLMKCDVT